MATFIQLLSDYVGKNHAYAKGNKVYIVDSNTMQHIETLPMIKYSTAKTFDDLAVYSGVYGLFLHDRPYLSYKKISFGKHVVHVVAPDTVQSVQEIVSKLEEGDKIHLKDKDGIYTFKGFTRNGMLVHAKTRGDFWSAIENYKCHAGGIHNAKYK